MKALITGDWHLTANPRDSYRWKFVEHTLYWLIKNRGVGLLLQLGDITEEKDHHPAELVNRVVTVFRNLSDLCPVVCLEGNHDGTSPGNPFFEFLSEISPDGAGDAISWVGRPAPLSQLGNVPTSFSAAESTLLLPNSRNPERDWEGIDFRSYKTIFAHQCFTGANSESGHKLSGTSLSYFPKGTRIVSGDIHEPQTLGPLTYVGSPYPVDFGDSFEPRVLLWDGESFESVPVPGPQKRLIEAASTKELLKSKAEKGDIVKVRLEVGSYDEWPEARQNIEAWAEAQGVVLHIAVPVVRQAVAKASAVRMKQQTDQEVLRAYAKSRELSEAYVKTGEKFL